MSEYRIPKGWRIDNLRQRVAKAEFIKNAKLKEEAKKVTSTILEFCIHLPFDLHLNRFCTNSNDLRPFIVQNLKIAGFDVTLHPELSDVVKIQIKTV